MIATMMVGQRRIENVVAKSSARALGAHPTGLQVHVQGLARRREHLAHHRLEVRERQRVVAGIEAVLVVERAERRALAEQRMAALDVATSLGALVL